MRRRTVLEAASITVQAQKGDAISEGKQTVDNRNREEDVQGEG